MNQVFSSVKPEAIVYQPLPDGKAFVLLHKDIEQKTERLSDGNEQDLWAYHEVQFLTELSKEEVEKRFDELYLTANIPAPTMTEVINDLSDMVDDLSARVEELEENANGSD